MKAAAGAKISAPKVVVAHHPTPRGGEDQLVVTLAGDVLRQGVDEGAGDRHRAPLVRLRRPVRHLPVELDRRLHHLDPTLDQIQPATCTAVASPHRIPM